MGTPMAATGAQSDANDRLTTRQFKRLSEFIYAYSGIKMPSGKLTMLEGRLRKRLRATGFADFEAYCDHLFEDDGLDDEAVALIDVVTTNKTDFFREPRHFEFLARVALPAIAERTGGKVRAWSAACSNGAEPYTMAMVLQTFCERQRPLNFSILATDLSTEVLDTACRGIFPEAMIEPVPADLRRRFIMRAVQPGRRDVRIHPELRSRIGFARLNLMVDSYGVGPPMDVIFCRNVLIYFDKATQVSVLRRLCDRLVSGGYLFIGHSETIQGADLPVSQVSHTVYRKD